MRKITFSLVQLFKNTKSDLGAYDKLLGQQFLAFFLHETSLTASIYTHPRADDKMKRQWEETSQEEKDKYGYERGLLDFLADLVADLDRRCCSIFQA